MAVLLDCYCPIHTLTEIQRQYIETEQCIVVATMVGISMYFYVFPLVSARMSRYLHDYTFYIPQMKSLPTSPDDPLLKRLLIMRWKSLPGAWEADAYVR